MLSTIAVQPMNVSVSRTLAHDSIILHVLLVINVVNLTHMNVVELQDVSTVMDTELMPVLMLESQSVAWE